MDNSKRKSIAHYLFMNVDKFNGHWHRKVIPISVFELKNLPHNEMLDDEFFREYDGNTTVSIHGHKDKEPGSYSDWRL